MSLLSDDIKSLLSKYSVRPRKERGQSFLKSKNIAKQIVTTADISEREHVLEIGGGLGILTSLLVEVAEQVTVIELEPGLVNALQDILGEKENVKIIHGDALKVDLPKVDKVVSNLPYSISSEMTFRLLTESTFELGVLMFQKEFSERLLAVPGSSIYSRLSIDFQYLGNATHVMEVGARNFYPIPAVNSTVLKITKRDSGPIAKNSNVFFWMVHGLYSYPNKQLRKALKIWFKNLGKSDLVEEVLSQLEGIDEKSRLRTLSQETLVRLSNVVNELVEARKLQGPKDDSQ
ncbi:MAG: 16S rRNA (adenine(1518)-N(6)/adenine(1519)-N(6))-dimethyltransferase RsmA [Candidatus Thorarchaeota archaeon]